MKKLIKLFILGVGVSSMLFSGCGTSKEEKVEQAGVSVILPEDYEQEEADYISGDVQFYFKKGLSKIAVGINKRGERSKGLTTEEVRAKFNESAKPQECTETYEYPSGQGFSLINTYTLSMDQIASLEQGKFYTADEASALKEHESQEYLSVLTIILSDEHTIYVSGYAVDEDFKQFKETMNRVAKSITISE